MSEVLGLRRARAINGRLTVADVESASEKAPHFDAQRRMYDEDDDGLDLAAETGDRTVFYVTFSDSETGRISDLYVFPDFEHRFDVEAILEEYGTKVGCDSMAVIYFGENRRWCWETYDFRTYEL